MIAQRLPNGMIVILMTAREASFVADELLDPERYPWQGTESEATAVEMRFQLRTLVAQQAAGELATATEMMLDQMSQGLPEPEESSE